MPIIKLFFTLFLLGNVLFAQQNNLRENAFKQPFYKKQSITKEAIEKYVNDDAFNYNIKVNKNSYYTKLKRWFLNLVNKISVWLFGTGVAVGFLATVLSTLPYILLAVLLFLLIRFFLKVNSRNLIYGEQNKPVIAFTDEEQIIKNEDINALIAEALKQNNYRLAIRYYYLLSLKKLTEANIIDWQPQKTNEDYKKEITQNKTQTQFNKITTIYDYVWYGEFDVDALKFEKLKGDFINLNKQLSN